MGHWGRVITGENYRDTRSNFLCKTKNKMKLTIESKNKVLYERAKVISKEILAPRAHVYDREAKFPRENFDDLIREGFTCLTLPGEYGGPDLYSDPVTYVMILFELSKGCVNTALLLHMHNSITHFLITLGTSDQKKHIADLVNDGKIIASHGGESGTSTQWNRKLDTRAELVDGKYVINGRKVFCSMAGEADCYTLWVQVGDDWDVRKSMCFLLCPADHPGFTIDNKWNSYALRGTVSHGIKIENVDVPANCLIGKGGDPIRVDITPKFGLGYAAVYLGVGAAAYEWALEYSRNRRLKPTNNPISSYQPIQRLLGEMKIEMEKALLMVQRAAWTLQAFGAEEAYPLISAAKFSASEASASITDNAVKLAGGAALLEDHPLERLHREARSGLVMPPNSEKCLDTVAKSVIEKNPEFAGTP